MPFLEQLWAAYLDEAIVTAKRFSSEFTSDSALARMDAGEREAAWVPTTNDANEGSLGSFRQFANRYPTAHTTTFTSIFMFLRNETEVFLQELLANEAVFLWVIREARRVDASGVERNRRKEINRLLNEQAAELRRKMEERRERVEARRGELEAVPLELDFSRLSGFTVANLRIQLEKHRLFDPRNIKSVSGNKKELLGKLRAAVDRYNTNLLVVGPSSSS